MKGLAKASTNSSTADIWSLSDSMTGAGARWGKGAGADTASPETSSPNASSNGRRWSSIKLDISSAEESLSNTK